MSYLDDDGLFGHDMRHKPPRGDLLTASGWGGSHGRLAYSNMVRSQESNYSEYALTTMGGVLRGYVIVNAKDFDYCDETAFKVAHNRVAIPVKEYAKQRMLTIREQWELMNPRWIGTFSDRAEDYNFYRKKRPSFSQSLVEAIKNDRYDEFIAQFWTFDDEPEIVCMMQSELAELQEKADEMREQMMSYRMKVSRVEHDVDLNKLNEYHLSDINAHEYLSALRRKLAYYEHEYYGLMPRINEIKEFINERTFNNYGKVNHKNQG